MLLATQVTPPFQGGRNDVLGEDLAPIPASSPSIRTGRFVVLRSHLLTLRGVHIYCYGGNNIYSTHAHRKQLASSIFIPVS